MPGEHALPSRLADPLRASFGQSCQVLHDLAPVRGDGYDHWGTDYALISLTHLWNWTGFPVAALPAGVGRSGLPVGVSLVGPAGADLRVASLAIALQGELGVPEPPALAR